MAQTEIEAIFRPKSGQVAASDTRKRLLRRGRRADPSEKNPSGGGWGGNCTPGRANPAQMSALRCAFGLDSGKLTIQVAPGHCEERSAQADDLRRRQVLDIQESAQGRNQPVAAVAVLVAVKPPLTNRLADEFQGAAAVLSLPKPIERLSRPVTATHAGVPRGLGSGLFANALRFQTAAQTARFLPESTNVAGGSRLSHAMHWPDAFAQNSERTARRVPSEQAKNRAWGPFPPAWPDRSIVSPSHPAGPSWRECGGRCGMLRKANIRASRGDPVQ